MPRRKKIINLSGHDILLKDIEPLLYDLLNEVKFSYIDSSSIEIINTSADNDSVIIQLKGDFLHISYLNSTFLPKTTEFLIQSMITNSNQNKKYPKWVGQKWKGRKWFYQSSRNLLQRLYDRIFRPKIYKYFMIGSVPE